MTDRSAKLLDVVALLRDLPELGLARGQVGTIVDEAGEATVLVEFTDGNGREFATPAVRLADLLVLAYEPEAAK